MQRYTIASPAFLLVLLLTAAVIVVAFYLNIAANCKEPFLYAGFDKIMGTALGVIGYYVAGKSNEVG
ncbi:MAG TPA: hypothetical protein VIS49_08535 [Cyclobacteriaceae bacterium]